MSKLDFDDAKKTITVRLDGLKRLVTMKSSVTLPARDVGSVSTLDSDLAVKAMAIHNLTRLRGNGRSPTGRYYGGVFTKTATMEHEFWDVDDTSRIVMIDMKRGPYSRVFLSFDDPEGMARMIRSRVHAMSAGQGPGKEGR